MVHGLESRAAYSGPCLPIEVEIRARQPAVWSAAAHSRVTVQLAHWQSPGPCRARPGPRGPEAGSRIQVRSREQADDDSVEPECMASLSLPMPT